MITAKFYEAIASKGSEQVIEKLFSFCNWLVSCCTQDSGNVVDRPAKLKALVSALVGVLDDAEQRQIRNEARVRAWLDEVQEAVFDAEDLLADVEYDALREAGEVREHKRAKRMNSFFFYRNSGERDLDGEMMKILDRLLEVWKQKDLLELYKRAEGQWQKTPSTSLVEESRVHGRQADEETLMKLLKPNDAARGEKLSVIPIVGMGGVGKTTLARSLFNDSGVADYFDPILWVSVSQNYNVNEVTKTLLQSKASSSSGNACDLDFVQTKLREKLSKKRFLIVLDDVWNEKYEDWQNMKKPFKDGAQGSRVIVTTRSRDVARIMGTCTTTTIYLNVLEEDASWKLFSEHAFGTNLNTNPDLHRVGRSFLAKCKGSPLALKTFGGLLRFNLDTDHWERTLAMKIWELTDTQSDILPSLMLSYHNLSLHLKRCFAYCAIFPKNYRFEKEELISLWMAQNLLEQPHGNRRIEQVGHQYFDILVSMSLIQPSSVSDMKFGMHDLIVDLATFVFGKYGCRRDSVILDDAVSKETMRHLACADDCDNYWERFNCNFKATQVRSFFVRCSRPRNVSHEVVHSLLSKMKHLRTLSFSGHSYNCEELVTLICELRHLRYLKLFDTSITSFPDSLCTLHNLQTLQFAGCESLCKLPEDFHHLRNLRYLDVSSTGIESLPNSICKLSNLQKLIVHGCSKLTSLPDGLHQITGLRFLNISSTGIQQLPNTLREMPNLKIV